MPSVEEIVDRAGATEGSVPDIRDRYRGTMLGLAIGNALGAGVEGWPAHRIRRRFPGGIRDIDPGERRAPWDDDLAQAVLLAEALLAVDGLDPADLAARLVRWFRDSGRGIGLLTSQVIGEMGRGTPDAARVVWERGGRRSAGNGAVMRCAPVALRWAGRGSELVRDARTSAVVTHHDPRCEWSTVATDVALAMVVGGERPDLGDLAAAVDDAGGPPEVGEHIRGTPQELDAFVLDGPDMGYTLKTMQVGLWAARHPGPPEETLVAVVSAGGDTDTNGAVAGAVLGAAWGASAWPQRWAGGLREPERLVAVADGLLAAATG